MCIHSIHEHDLFNVICRCGQADLSALRLPFIQVLPEEAQLHRAEPRQHLQMMNEYHDEGIERGMTALGAIGIDGDDNCSDEKRGDEDPDSFLPSLLGFVISCGLYNYSTYSSMFRYLSFFPPLG